jgi:hypothetical protein
MKVNARTISTHLLKTLPLRLVAALRRFPRPRRPLALANALGLFGEKTETLLLDPASLYNAVNPWPGVTSQATRFLLVQRGASGYQYGDLATGTALPLGVTPDAPLNASDPFAIIRFGAHPGLFLGVAATAVTIDHLVYATAKGQVADLSLAANGTYWVVGRAAASLVASADLGEIAYVPCTPYQLAVTTGVFTYPANPV